MNSNMLFHILGGQKSPAYIDMEFRFKLIYDTGTSNLHLDRIINKLLDVREP